MTAMVYDVFYTLSKRIARTDLPREIAMDPT